MDLSIIIVNWNSKEYLRKCLLSIFAETSGIEFEVIVIDSASFDGCGEMLKENFPSVRFIQSEANLGFAKANNQAFSITQGACVLFLNPDTELIGPAINIMSGYLHSHPKAGAVGCKLLNSDGTLQTSCIQSTPTLLNQLLDSEFLRSLWPKSALWGVAPLFNDSQPDEVDTISGACVMVKREVFKRISGFSEEYFMYSEDIDLSLKVRQSGYSNFYLPTATVIHHGGGSSQRTVSSFTAVMMQEARWRFFRKTRGKTYGAAYRVIMLLSALGRLLILLLALPIRLIRSSHSRQAGSIGKWRAVLRWSLNRERWIKRYYPY